MTSGVVYLEYEGSVVGLTPSLDNRLKVRGPGSVSHVFGLDPACVEVCDLAVPSGPDGYSLVPLEAINTAASSLEDPWPVKGVGIGPGPARLLPASAPSPFLRDRANHQHDQVHHPPASGGRVYLQYGGSTIKQFPAIDRRLLLAGPGSVSAFFQIDHTQIQICDVKVPCGPDGLSEICLAEISGTPSSPAAPWPVQGSSMDPLLNMYESVQHACVDTSMWLVSYLGWWVPCGGGSTGRKRQ